MFASIGAIALLALIVGIGWLYIIGPWRAVDFSLSAPAPPALLSEGESVERWRARRETLRTAFERDVYGAMPAPIAPHVAEKIAIPSEDAGGVAGVEQWRVELGKAGHFHLAIVRPPGATLAPVILTLNFAGNRAAFPNRPRAVAGPVGYIQWFCRSALIDPISERIFGRHINSPPFHAILARGYAIALLYVGDIVPDRETEARSALARFASEETGALAGWAWTASRAYEALASDVRFDASRISVWGQSRQGKAALVAGAFDERFAAIVALQTGRGGDAPTRAFNGEPVAHMLKTYPHWFAPRFARTVPTVEQHQLLALIAPRPLLLGHGRRDTWSDPVGARAMREAAAPAFALLDAPPPSHFIRDGAHGIHRRDWEETLNFLDARLPR